jgi:hypothetical protein
MSGLELGSGSVQVWMSFIGSGQFNFMEKKSSWNRLEWDRINLYVIFSDFRLILFELHIILF